MSVESSLWQRVKERGAHEILDSPSLLPRCSLHCPLAPFALALPPSHGHQEKVDQEQVPRCLVARQWCFFLRLGGSDCSMTLSLEQIHCGHFSGFLLLFCRTGKKPKKSNTCFEKCTMQWKTVSDAGAPGMSPTQRCLRDRKNCCEFIQPLPEHINKTPQWHVTSCLLISEEPPLLRNSNIYQTSHKMLGSFFKLKSCIKVWGRAYWNHSHSFICVWCWEIFPSVCAGNLYQHRPRSVLGENFCLQEPLTEANGRLIRQMSSVCLLSIFHVSRAVVETLSSGAMLCGLQFYFSCFLNG